MTHDIKEQTAPRNFFAEWNQRETKQDEESVSLLAVLKDVSGMAGFKALPSKTETHPHR